MRRVVLESYTLGMQSLVTKNLPMMKSIPFACHPIVALVLDCPVALESYPFGRQSLVPKNLFLMKSFLVAALHLVVETELS